MLVALINLELGEQTPPKPILRHHALYRPVDKIFGLFGPDLRHGTILFAAFPSGIAHVFLVRFFSAGDAHFFGVDDYDEIASIQMGSISRLIAAAEHISDLDRQAAQHSAV